MLFYLFAFFVLLPLVELTLLLWLGQATDWKVSVLLVISTGIIGAALSRSQGSRAMRRVQAELQQGRFPADAMLDGLLVFAAGLLLLTPGMITDLIGVSLLLPASRSLWKRLLAKKFKDTFSLGRQSPPHSSNEGQIDNFGGSNPSGRRIQVIDSYVVNDDAPTKPDKLP